MGLSGVTEVFILHKVRIGRKEVEEKGLTVCFEISVFLICGIDGRDVGVPNILNVSTKNFSCPRMTGFVVDVELFWAASAVPGVENSDEAFDVGCVWTEGKVLFLGDGVTCCFVCVSCTKVVCLSKRRFSFKKIGGSVVAWSFGMAAILKS